MTSAIHARYPVQMPHPPLLPRALSVAALLFTAGCPIVFGPDDRRLVMLFDFQVPATATFADTIRIGFAFDGACGTDVAIRTHVTSTRVEIEGRAPRDLAERICLAAIVPVRQQIVLLPAQRSQDITVVFHQPGPADSVRTIDIRP